MTAREAQRLLDHWRHRLDIGPWNLKPDWVPEATLEDGTLGEVGEWKDYGATIRVALKQEDPRATIIHEELHCLSRDTVHRAFEALREDLSGPVAALAEKTWLIEEERLVRRLERVIVHLLEGGR